MSITRIQNNQITDSTIIGYSKIQAGTLTGNLFSASGVTFNSNVFINGNLFLGNTGNTVTINATNTYVNDPIVVFNNGYVGSLSGYDIGILVNRNLTNLPNYGSVNTAWVWVEDDKAFEAIATTDVGTGAASINNSGYLNIKVGNSTIVTNQTVGGLLSTGTLSVSGASTVNTITGASFQGVIGNVTPAAGTFTSATVNGTVIATSVAAATVGNVGASIIGNGGFLSNIIAANIGGTVATANATLYTGITNTSSGTYYPVLSGRSSTGNTAASASASLSYDAATGALTATSFSGSGASLTNLTGAQVQGTVTTANVAIYENLTNTTTNASFYPSFYDKATGNALPYTNTSFNFNPSTGTLTATIFSGSAAGLTNIPTPGAANVAIYEQVNAWTNNQTFYPMFANLSINGNTLAGVNSSLTYNPSTGTLASTAFSGSGSSLTNLPGAQVLGTVATANVAIYEQLTNSSTNATFYPAFYDKATGNAIAYTNTSVNVNPSSATISALAFAGGSGSFTTLSASGVTTITNTTDSTAVGTGALQVSGGASFFSNVYIGGNLYVANIFSQTQSVITIEDPLVYFYAAGNVGQYNYDIGFYSDYSAPGYRHTGLARQFNGNTWVFFSNLTEPEATTINWNDPGIAYDSVKAGSLILANSTASSSTTTGALVVTGGVGVGGTVTATTFSGSGSGLTALPGSQVQGTVTTGNVSIYEQVTPFTTNQTFYPMFSNLSIAGNSVAGVSSSLSYNPSTGTLSATTFSGVGNFSTVYTTSTITASGNIVAQSGTPSTTTTTGALVVNGGVGITGALNIGGNIADNGGGLTTTQTTAYLFNDTATTLNIGSAATTLNMGSSSGTFTIANPTLVGTQATQAVYNTTATTVNAFGAATSLNMGAASGTATINNTTLTLTNATTVNVNGANPTLATSSTGTVTLFNTNATTVNAFGAATTINVGNSGGITNWNGVFKNSGNVMITSGTDVVSTTTGALMLTGSGGLNVGGNAYVGNNLYVGSNALALNLTTPTIVAVDNGSSYTQAAIQNRTNSGSADWIAYGNNYAGASNDHGWVDVGFTSDAFADPSGLYTITKANDAYLFGSAANATVGGNLVLATDYTGSYNDIVFGVGSFYANSEVARFHGNTSNSGYLTLEYTTNQTGAPTSGSGALRVSGGASFASNVYVGGAMTINGAQTSNYDFKVSGNRTSNLLWARPNSTYDAVIIGNTTPVASLVNGAALQIATSDSIMLPVGTTAQRPQSAGLGTDTPGMLRYSSTRASIEWYDGSGWQIPASNFTVITDQQFTGDGSQTNFTLSTTQTTASTIVSINGVLQIPTLAYSVSGTTLAFTEPPPSGDIIDVRQLTTTTTVTIISSTNGYVYYSTDNNGAYVYAGSSSPVLQYTFEPVNGAFVTNGSNVTVASASVATLVDSLWANTYSSAEYTVTSVIRNTNIRQVDRIHLVHSGDATGAGTATIAVYGTVNTAGNSLVTWSATTSGNVAQLNATTTNNNTVMRIKRIYQAI